jgi:Ankyrin repeats (3 copies)/Ankyrin repeat
LLIVSNRFRWVICQLDTLRRCLPSSIRKALNELPTTLDDTYERVLQGISKERRQHAHLAFQCLIAAIRPLRIEELAEIFAIDFDQDETCNFMEGWRPEDSEEAVLSTFSTLISVIEHRREDDEHEHEHEHEDGEDDHGNDKDDHREDEDNHGDDEDSHGDDKDDRGDGEDNHGDGEDDHEDDEDDHGDDEDNHGDVVDDYEDDEGNWEDVEDDSEDVKSDHGDGEDNREDDEDNHGDVVDDYEDDGEDWEDVEDDSEDVRDNHEDDGNEHGDGEDHHEDHKDDYKDDGDDHKDNEDNYEDHEDDYEDEDDYKNKPSSSRFVQFSHFSVEEFLTSERLRMSEVRSIRDYHVPLDFAHAVFARACLAVLLHLDENVHKKHLETSPLVSYATQYWVEHTKYGDVASRVQSSMEELFNPKKRHLAAWISIHDVARDWYGQSLGYYPTRPQLPSGAATLFYAAFCGLREVADHLITTHAADVNAHYGDLGAPLHMASGRGHAEVVHLLLQRNADVDVRLPGYQDWTPLCFASYHGHARVVQLLLEHGADVNVQSLSDSTPLWFASEEGHLEVVRLLLGHGADVRIRGLYSHTPLQRATNVEIAQLLLKHGAGRG